MKLELKKFGTTLISHPDGREAWLSAQAYILPAKSTREKIEVDFSGVSVLSPSWADEFITQLQKNYPNQVVLLPSDNPTVKATLETILK